MNDTTKTGESRQELQDCVETLLAERTRERKFRAEFEEWLEERLIHTTDIYHRDTPQYREAIYDVLEKFNELEVQHLASEKESEGERDAMPTL